MAKAKTTEQFKKEVFDIFGTDYTVLEEYQTNRIPIKIRHNLCGNEFKKIPKDMVGQKHSGCPYCYGNKNKLYNEEWVKNNTPLPYHYIGGYGGMKTKKSIFHCDNCNIDFEQYPSRLINEHIYGCNCCKTKKKTHSDFLKEIEDILSDYEIISKYINADTKITFKHLLCGATFDLEPEKFLHRYHKQYCPICYYKKSKGEIKIDSFLVKNNIQYNREYIFNELPNRRFDFYLPNHNCCIEFDGKQHFEAIDFFGGEASLKTNQERDKEKNLFCLKNNIILYRIPYTDIDNIDLILTQIFKEKSSETIEKYKTY